MVYFFRLSFYTNYETFVGPHTAIAHESIEGISPKRSPHAKAKKVDMEIITNM